MNYQQLNRYRCPDQDKDMTRRVTRLSTTLHQENVLKEMKKQRQQQEQNYQHTLQTQYTLKTPDRCTENESA